MSTNPAKLVQSASEDAIKSVRAQFAPMYHLHEKVIELQMNTLSQILDFMGRRMKAQSDFFHSLGQCHDLTKMSEVQSRFWQRVSEDYTTEVGQLTEMARESVDKIAKAAASKTPQSHAA
ncbi:phasin family protein [Methylovirgula sp. 4M-Z18]|uniref:phasin family protein n=1 Tax=Methylovirgula sp. 4M-Z18 TaxID=2293567 RepID=UPI0013140F7E|nr:phasin family protein [Methylovirgula sp. 4M-Z18]